MRSEKQRRKGIDTPGPKPRYASQRGVALLLAVFGLLLISGLAISLILAAGTESSIVGNYRGSTQAFYAAYSGIEEARGRLSKANPDYFGTFVAPYGTVLGVDQVRYVLTTSETVDPTNLLPSNPYRDTEYQQEFGYPVPAVNGTTVRTTPSKSAIAGLAGPVFKWVRITAKTEFSSHNDIDNDTIYDSTKPVYYDGTNQNIMQPPVGRQVFTITSLAVTPNGSRRILQYNVAPALPLPIEAALYTRLSVQTGRSLNVIGNKEQACTIPSLNGIKSGTTVTIPPGSEGNIMGTPSSFVVSAPFDTTYDINKLFAKLRPGATTIDAAGTGVAYDATALPPGYFGPNAQLGVLPTTVPAVPPPNQISSYSGGTAITYYSPGNLTLGSTGTTGQAPQGYGILLVNGDLTIDASHGFYYFGLILVKGNIVMKASSGSTTGKDIHGAIIATGTFDATQLSGLLGGNSPLSIQQNACLIIDQLERMPLTVLSFREIPE